MSNKQMTKKRTILFTIVITIAVFVSMQVVHGLKGDVLEGSTLGYEEQEGHLLSLLSNYAQIREYCSIQLNDTVVSSCNSLMSNIDEHLTQAFNESRYEIGVIRKHQQSANSIMTENRLDELLGLK
jgi:hypothetical protein